MSLSGASVDRFGGRAALAAAVALLFYDVPHFFLGTDVREAGRPLFVFHAVMGLLALILLAVVLVAVLHWVEATAGLLGFMGLVAALAGTMLVAGGEWGEAFLLPALRGGALGVVEHPSGTLLVGFLVSSGVFALGWTLVAMTLRRAGVVSAGAAALLGAGAVASALPFPGSALLLAGALVLLAKRLSTTGPVAPTGRGFAGPRGLQRAAGGRKIAS